MFDSRPKAVKLVVAVIVLSISQIYVTANSTIQTSQDQTVQGAVPMVGRLEVHRARTIRVDDNNAEDGATILDGQTLETSDCASATVYLLPVGTASSAVAPIGQVDLASNTKAVINYSAGKVTVTLIRGCARERMSMTIDASITMSNGTSTVANQSPSDNQKVAEACDPSDKKESYSPSCVPAIVWVGGAGAVAATAATFVAVGGRGENPSPDTPTP